MELREERRHVSKCQTPFVREVYVRRADKIENTFSSKAFHLAPL